MDSSSGLLDLSLVQDLSVTENRGLAAINPKLIPRLSMHDAMPISTDSYAAALLLAAIAFHSTELDPRLGNVEVCERLCQHSDLREILANALKTQDFSTVLRLKILRRPESLNRQSLERAMRAAWEMPFHGHSHEVLLHSIQNMMELLKPDHFYANHLPIIQSSGTGKSRMVDELARLIFTIPFNVRESVDKGFPFPHSDSAVRNFLVDTKFKTWEGCRDAYHVFFEKLFDQVYDWLDRNWGDTHFQTSRDFASTWREQLATEATGGKHMRGILYDTVIDNCHLPENVDLHAAKDRTVKAGNRLATWIASHVDGQKSPNGSSHVKQPGDSMRHPRVNERPRSKRTAQFIIYFDEAHTLADAYLRTQVDGKLRSRFHALCAVLNDLLTVDLFVITLSTNFTLHNLAPTRDKHHSERVSSGGDFLQSPYTELPFDCLHKGKPLIGHGEKTLADLSSVIPTLVHFLKLFLGGTRCFTMETRAFASH
ncbi:uncharacterized protein FIBRA_01254 [Fibroporia radiculosa]|uniref:Uncharacterized protein n=1 Tax=Fibroporia radiculosa TaxID=599839 RepID=J4H101_9APHY|nr:uncharacterized protein FIBRA_01254 [Fibroporia radiculosa]CCL99239.1 predicted protein [Fibroporia radiculosa]